MTYGTDNSADDFNFATRKIAASLIHELESLGKSFENGITFKNDEDPSRVLTVSRFETGWVIEENQVENDEDDIVGIFDTLREAVCDLVNLGFTKPV